MVRSAGWYSSRHQLGTWLGTDWTATEPGRICGPSAEVAREWQDSGHTCGAVSAQLILLFPLQRSQFGLFRSQFPLEFRQHRYDVENHPPAWCLGVDPLRQRPELDFVLVDGGFDHRPASRT